MRFPWVWADRKKRSLRAVSRGHLAALYCLLWLSGTALVQAQDMSVTALLQPRTGCALSAAETIRVRAYNYGSALPGASIFSWSYTINGAAPVTETVFMGNSVPPNGTLTYTFNQLADLSAPGIYLISASINVTGDTNPANNAIAVQSVQSWDVSVGGTIPALPGPTLSGALKLGGQRGAIIEWQQSADGQRWRALENTSATQAFSALTEPTRFRVLVQNGPCAPAYSSSALVSTAIDIFSNGFEP